MFVFAGTNERHSVRSFIPDWLTFHALLLSRIGSDAEQDAIREILREQDEYMLREVYALPEYESVRYRW